MEKKQIIIAMAAIVLVTIIVSFLIMQKRKRTLMNLAEALVRRDFKHFDQMISSDKIRKSLPAFNLDYLNLNRALLEKDTRKIDECFQVFDSVNLNASQKREIALSGFAYYLGRKDKEKCHHYLEMMENSNVSENIKAESREYYEVLFEKKTDGLDRLLAETEKLPEKERGPNEYLISVIYENLNDRKKADEYRKLSAEHAGKETK